MGFTPIDMKTWERAGVYRFFDGVSFSATKKIDVTKLVSLIKTNGLKFFPSMMWLVTRELNKQKEFCTGICDGELGYFDGIVPGFPSFHDDSKLFSILWQEYDASFPAFYARYTELTEKYGGSGRFYARRDKLMPQNAYICSCTPWLHFDSFSVSSERRFLLPTVEIGKYEEHGGKLLLPVAVYVFHSVTDGYHVSRFFEGLQESCDGFCDIANIDFRKEDS